MNLATELRSASVHAGGRTVLGPLDLEVPSGQHLVIVGPSGCGKTTLLRLIAGLAQPHSGTVHLQGTAASEGRRILLPCEKRGIGMLFQDGALWPHMTAAKTLDFVLRHAGVAASERKTRIPQLLEWVELSGFEKRKPGTLSGGEAQRLSLARALASDPRILLLDEPLGPLDADLRNALLQRIDRIQKERQLTVIHVTHDPEESRQYADRTIAMVAGKIVDDQLHAQEEPCA
ncbi:MAG: iron(III) transport system ATP-binding protein [Candidatus Paceibacteria bacterium]